jgi:hypothetical protein
MIAVRERLRNDRLEGLADSLMLGLCHISPERGRNSADQTSRG